MGFQVGCLHGNSSISSSMTFVKCILCKINHLVPDFLCNVFGNTSVYTAVNFQILISIDKTRSFFIHDFLLFLSHRFADQIGPSHGETGQLSYDLHYLLLKDNYSVCGIKNVLQFWSKILNGCRIMLSLDIIRYIIHRTRTIKSNACNNIFKAGWLQLFHEVFHPFGFQLKDTICITWSNQLQGFFIVQDLICP